MTIFLIELWLYVQGKKTWRMGAQQMYPTFFHFFSEKLLMQYESAKKYNRTTSRLEPRLVYKHTPTTLRYVCKHEQTLI